MEQKPEEILAELERIHKESPGSYKKWLSFTVWQMKICFNRTKLQRFSAEDLIEDVIEKLIDGKRKWDKDKYPDLNKFMYRLICSHVKNLAKKKERHVYDYNFGEHDCPNDEVGKNTSRAKTSEQIFDYVEEDQGKFHLTDACFDALEKDRECQKVFHLLIDGKKNRQIADELKMKTSDIVNIKKRIFRKVKPVIENEFAKRKIKLPVKKK